jgi:two-component system, sensor histidine kinase PdtaS
LILPKTTNVSRSRSALKSLDRLQWGDHVCQFFHTANDLSEILVPYFKTGLERNEACVWVTSSPYPTAKVISDMRAAVSDFDHRVAAGQIQIVGHDEWYTRHGALNPTETIQDWLSRKETAIGSGYAGLRITGNTSFLDDIRGMFFSIMSGLSTRP